MLCVGSIPAIAQDEALPWIQIEDPADRFTLFHPPDWEAKTIVGDVAVFRLAGGDGGCSVLAAALEPVSTTLTEELNRQRLTRAFAPELLIPDKTLRFGSFGAEELQGLRGLRVVFDRPSSQNPELFTREKLVAVARGDQGFAVRCSAPSDRFDGLLGEFDGVIVSLRWKDVPEDSTVAAAQQPPAAVMPPATRSPYFPIRVADWLLSYLLCAPLLAVAARRRGRNPWAWGLLGGLAGPLSFIALYAKPKVEPPAEADDSGGSEVGSVTPETATEIEQTQGGPWPPNYRTLHEANPAGVGGWLVLPLFGLFMTVFISGKALFVDTLPVLLTESWATLTSPESPAYSSYWGPYILVSGLFNLLLATGAIALIVLFLVRKRSLPRFISIFYAFGVVTAAFEALSVRYLANELPDLFEANAVTSTDLALVRNLIVAAVWISYFRVSRRVRNTFVVP